MGRINTLFLLFFLNKREAIYCFPVILLLFVTITLARITIKKAIVVRINKNKLIDVYNITL